MNALGWPFLALVLIPVLQVPAVWFLSRYVELEDGELGHVPTGYAFAREPGQRHPDAATADDGQAAPNVLRCSSCGVTNSRSYRYCKHCAGLL